MLKKVIAVVAVVVVALVAYIATRPSEFRVARSRAVAAPPDVVHGYVNDFRKWPEWSPWEKLDPAMKRELSGAPAGPGAVYAQSVTIRLEFIKPWTATNTVWFDFAPTASGTNVTWAMTGHKDFMAKAFTLFMDMDRMIGPDFEQGLANLDAATSGKAARAGS